MSNDLHTYIEPELEARITALVLGEVGEFDVDELERIIQEQPELQIFRRRMEVMHELLGETVKPEKDEAWQLSDDRRAELRRKFSKTSEPAHRQSSVITRIQWRSALGIAACLLVCLVIFSMMTPNYKSASFDRTVSETVSYQAAYEDEEDFDRKGMVLLKTDLPKETIQGSPSPSTNHYWKRSAKNSEDSTLADLPSIGRLFKEKKKAAKQEEKSKDAAVAHYSYRKKSMPRGVVSKPSAPSSSMAKVIAANTSSDTAILVPDVDVDMDVPDPSLAFGDADDFGDGWENVKGETSGAFGKGGKKGSVVWLESGLKIEGEDFDGFSNMGSPITSGKDSLGGGLKHDLSGGIVGYVSDVEVIREFKYPTEYDPPELPNSITNASKFSKDEKGSFPVTPATPTSFETRKTGVVLEVDSSTVRAGEKLKVEYEKGTKNFPSKTIVQKEIARRSSTIKGADQKLMGGRDAYSKQDYQKAAKSYREALALLPPGPASDGRRKAYQNHLGDANVALAQKYRRMGKYDQARKALEETLSQDPTNFAAKKQLAYLDDPTRTNPALTAKHTQNVDKVRRHLYMGEGYYNLGQYEKAEAEFKKVLLTDNYNKAARRWLEKSASVQSDYYRAAYDHTRAHLLAEVDKAWEMSVPADLPVAPRNKPKPAKPVPPMSKKIAVIKVELQQKTDHVAELRSRLMDVAEKSGIIYMETESGDKTIGTNSGLVEMAEKELYQAERDKEQLSFQINKLLAFNNDELVAVVADLPDIGFKNKYNEYKQAKRELLTLQAQGLADRHPSVKKSQSKVDALEKSLEKRALSVRDSLKHRLTILEQRSKKMSEVVNAQKDKGTSTARDIQEFNLARKEYQTALAIKDAMEVAYDREKTKAILNGEIKPSKPVVPTIPSPKRPEPLPEETSTSAQPFSTFSLNVSDVSFKLAKVALLEKGQWPESSKVRTEEFVNAFDYGDPSPRRGESVACAIEQSAHPFLQQRNILRIGMKTAALGRSTPLRLTVLLDNSGSMEREDREASVLAAIRVLASQLGPQDKITLVGFARTPRLLADRISGDKAGQLVNIVANTPSEGGTNIEEALVLARQLAKRQHTEGAQDRIVLITDGVANLGNTVPDELSRQIEIMRQEGIAFDACGVGAEGLNDEILEAMTRKGDGRYYFLNRPEDADSGFAKQLAGALSPAAKNVKVQVVFNPKRVSKYRLLGFNKHRLNKEDFRNDQVDAAEMAAEEAGNAVYQIEVNPNGEGELGEVFVRFLDANTNQMVERSWPMAYESQVKPFDLTTASMQLAGVASQLGEKLHGTDAGSVRFQNITSTLGKLRAHYQHNPKVQNLIRMCEKVK